ncbi:MAG: TonB-dependent receptor [Alphaproteobacteria bacterium]|nr:TonB-dependent receptor [Alphaproteobacteria bacterium]MDE2495554.1 TonB-dependent receptor [Alphaproteobacteria bacterium]
MSYSTKSRIVRGRMMLGASAMALATMFSAAQAQNKGVIETVVVTGYRASLENALKTKFNSDEMVDAIDAEDIAQFPDANLAEALQRLPGVAVDRDNGEGRTITVRGLGSNFTRVTLNGLETLSTAGASSSGASPNRDRGFDFNTFAAELFNSLKVQKSASAATEEGSLGATVELYTPRPFDVGRKFVVGMQDAFYEYGKAFNPRITGLVSDVFFGGRVGVLASVAYSSRSQYIDSYGRQPGQSDFTYRGSDFKWDTKTAKGFDNVSGGLLNRNGFAAPTGSACNGAVAPYSDGVIPGMNITYAPYCAALSGSDPAAYALVNAPQGWTTTDTNSKAGKTSSKITAPGSTVIIPALPGLNHQELYQSRIGLTGSVEWQPDDDTLFSLDGLFSSAYQDSTNYGIGPIGTNRNNTQTALITGSASKSFTTCSPQTGSATQADIQCYSAKNLDPYTYYTDPAYGYNPNGSDALAAAISFVGRPSTKLIGAKVQNGAATYLKLDNVDFRSGADEAYYTTQFEQVSLHGSHNFSDRFKGDMTVGWSHSYNHQTGLLAEVNRMDSGTASGNGYFVWDATAGGEMPAMNYGFNVADPANWTFVKDFSALRHYEYYTGNTYRTLIANLSYEATDQLTFRAGATARIFDFNTSYYQRAMKDVINPSFQEAGVTTAEMTRIIRWGNGLSVPSGTPTSFVVPNLRKYENVIGFNCNCINQYGDWRLTNLFNPASTGTAGRTFGVSEHSKAYYAQIDFQDINIFDKPLRGNVGGRFVTTEVNATGHALQGAIVTAHHSYNDFLPSINLVYSLTDDMLLRAASAKVIARPSLGLMAPSITSMKIPTNAGETTGATAAFGNTNLAPFRANTVDLGWEWYFDKGAIIAVTGFAKWVSSNPQIVVSSGALSDFFTSGQLSTFASYYCNTPDAPGSTTNANECAYLSTPSNSIAVTQAENGPGGVLEGVEVTYQQHLDFIPPVFGGDGFGVNANYTHIKSVQHYIINSTSKGNTMADGPWNGASPDAFNFTLYYDGQNWSGRLSTAYRSSYLYLYPVAGGSDVLGYGNSPLVNDFGYSKNTLNVDASASYDINDNMELTLDALNLTNQPDRRWAYVNSPQVTNYASTGREIYIGFRLKY